MIRFAICDDDREFAHKFGKKLLDEYNKDSLNGEAADYVYYENELEVLKNFEKDSIDIFILDIEYGSSQGLDVARKLEKRRENVGIVYITNYEYYVTRAFVCRPLGFIRKQHIGDDLTFTMNSIREYLEKDRFNYIFPDNKKEIQVHLSKVLRIEVYGHNMEIITRNKTMELRCNLSRIEKDVMAMGFAKISRSCLINMRYIEQISDDEIKMTNHDILHISKDRKKRVTEQWYKYKSTC